MKVVAQSLSTLIGVLAILFSVVVMTGGGGAGWIVFGLLIGLLGGVGTWAVIQSRTWGPLLLALWLAVGVAVVQIQFSNITGIGIYQAVFAALAVVEIGAAVVLARAPRAKAG